jgi:hypothetical protein
VCAAAGGFSDTTVARSAAQYEVKVSQREQASYFNSELRAPLAGGGVCESLRDWTCVWSGIDGMDCGSALDCRPLYVCDVADSGWRSRRALMKEKCTYFGPLHVTQEQTSPALSIMCYCPVEHARPHAAGTVATVVPYSVAVVIDYTAQWASASSLLKAGR